MMRVEEMTVVGATAEQARRHLLSISRWGEWQAPDMAVAARHTGAMLAPGDHFRLEILGGVHIEYMVEAMSDREVVFAFDAPWGGGRGRGRERWSFVPDGAETIVRRVYELEDDPSLIGLAWRTSGWLVVSAHYKLELARFRAAVERDPGPRGEIEAPPYRPEASVPPPSSSPPSFPVDEG